MTHFPLKKKKVSHTITLHCVLHICKKSDIDSPNDGKGRKLLEVKGKVQPETGFKKSCDGLWRKTKYSKSEQRLQATAETNVQILRWSGTRLRVIQSAAAHTQVLQQFKFCRDGR